MNCEKCSIHHDSGAVMTSVQSLSLMITNIFLPIFSAKSKIKSCSLFFKKRVILKNNNHLV